MIEFAAEIQIHIIQYLDDTATSLLRTTCSYFQNIITSEKCRDICYYAVEHNNPNLLKMGRNNWDQYLFKAAIINDAFECAKYLYDNGCQTCEPLHFVEYKHCSSQLCNWYKAVIIFYLLECFILKNSFQPHANKFLTKKVLQINKARWSTITARMIAIYGSKKLMKYFITNGGKHDESVIIAACYNRSASCLKYFHKLGYKLDYLYYYYATRFDSIDCVKYLNKQIKINEVNIATIIANVAESGASKSFCYMIEEYGPGYLTSEVFTWAIIGGSIDILKCIFQLATINDRIMHPTVIIYANIIVDDDSIFINAIDSKCANYLRQAGWPWSRTLYYKAIQMDNLKCLKYLFENNCPLFEESQAVTSLQDISALCRKIQCELLRHAHGTCHDYLQGIFTII